MKRILIFASMLLSTPAFAGVGTPDYTLTTPIVKPAATAQAMCISSVNDNRKDQIATLVLQTATIASGKTCADAYDVNGVATGSVTWLPDTIVIFTLTPGGFSVNKPDGTTATGLSPNLTTFHSDTSTINSTVKTFANKILPGS